MELEARRVSVFFYGTFMNPGVLAEYGIIAGDLLPAKVAGFELYIRPRVNLVLCERASVYGAIALVTHKDLEKIYSELEKRFDLRYLPEAVLAETLSGTPTVKAALHNFADDAWPGCACIYQRTCRMREGV